LRVADEAACQALWLTCRQKQSAEIPPDLGPQAVFSDVVRSEPDLPNQADQVIVGLIDEVGLAHELLQSSKRLGIGRLRIRRR
jgi:hypothetical protein